MEKIPILLPKNPDHHVFLTGGTSTITPWLDVKMKEWPSYFQRNVGLRNTLSLFRKMGLYYQYNYFLQARGTMIIHTILAVSSIGFFIQYKEGKLEKGGEHH